MVTVMIGHESQIDFALEGDDKKRLVEALKTAGPNTRMRIKTPDGTVVTLLGSDIKEKYLPVEP